MSGQKKQIEELRKRTCNTNGNEFCSRGKKKGGESDDRN